MTRLRPNLQRQRGAFSILSAATLVMAILFLALVVDSGRLYLEQRKLQKLADTAALESISRLESGNCALDTVNAHLYAVENAASYGFVGNGQQSLASSCVSISIIDGLRVPTADPAGGRAVRVVTRNEVPASIIVRSGGLFGLPGNSTVGLQAVAVAEKDREPMAVFSVGAQLLDLSSNGLVPRLLKTAGVDVTSLTLLDSEGLANAQITPGGLLQALGVNVGINQLKALTPEGLVNLVDTQIGVIGIQKLIDVSASLVTHNETLAADIKALGGTLANSQLNNATVNLLATDERPGLLKLVTGSGQSVGSALDAKLSLGDVLSTGLMTGVQGRGLVLDELKLLANANGDVALGLKMGIVEPPAIGIGPVGTTAFNAQMRLQLDVNSSNLPVVGGLLDILGTSLSLPITLDLASAEGVLTNIDCSLAKPEATIDVESTIGNICIGSMPANTLWSTSASCLENALQKTSILKVLNFDLISGKVAVPLMTTGKNPSRDTITLPENESESTLPNPLDLEKSISNLLLQLPDVIKTGLSNGSNSNPAFTPVQAAQISEKYLSAQSYDKNKVRDALRNDGLNWKRPAILGLVNTGMPDEWLNNIPLLFNCASSEINKAFCRAELTKSLQTKEQCGVLGCILDSVAQSLGLSTNSQPLLLAVVEPVATIVSKLSTPLSTAVSNLLKTLGLELGESEIKVHSISCGLPRLVQ